MYLSKQAKPVSQGLNDWMVLEDMKRALERHLSAALAECAAIARDLASDAVDADQVLIDIRMEFDPINENARIHDCFADAFKAHFSVLKDAGCEPIARLVK